VTHSNQAALQLTGYDVETLTRKYFPDLIHDSDADRIQGLIQQLCKGQPVHAEFQILSLSGQVLDVFTSFLPVKTEGTVSCIYAVMHDITEKKQAERRMYQSEQRFHALVELSHAMPWSLDLTTGCFSFMGKQIEQHLGYPVDSWVNMATWASRMHAEDREKALNLCAEATNRGEEHQFACRMLAADGSYVPVQIHISVLMAAGRAIELRGFYHKVFRCCVNRSNLIIFKAWLKNLSPQIFPNAFARCFHAHADIKKGGRSLPWDNESRNRALESALADTGCLTAQFTQIVQLGATNAAMTYHCDTLQHGGVQREYAFHTNIAGNLANSEAAGNAIIMAGNHNALIGLQTLGFDHAVLGVLEIDNTDIYADSIALTK
jgi:PAS domain S-box-containing protein